MGQFSGNPEDSSRGFNPTIRELMVQLVDIFCSRKYASWLPGVEMREEDIKKFILEKNED